MHGKVAKSLNEIEVRPTAQSKPIPQDIMSALEDEYYYVTSKYDPYQHPEAPEPGFDNYIEFKGDKIIITGGVFPGGHTANTIVTTMELKNFYRAYTILLNGDMPDDNIIKKLEELGWEVYDRD